MSVTGATVYLKHIPAGECLRLTPQESFEPCQHQAVKIRRQTKRGATVISLISKLCSAALNLDRGIRGQDVHLVETKNVTGS